MNLTVIAGLLKKFWWLLPLAMLTYYLYRTVDRWADRADVKSEISQHEKAVVQVTETETINLNQIAINIYDSFHRGRVFGFSFFEDEKEAIRNILKVPKNQIHSLAAHYARVEGKNENLYYDFRKYLTDKQYIQIENLLE